MVIFIHFFNFNCWFLRSFSKIIRKFHSNAIKVMKDIEEVDKMITWSYRINAYLLCWCVNKITGFMHVTIKRVFDAIFSLVFCKSLAFRVVHNRMLQNYR